MKKYPMWFLHYQFYIACKMEILRIFYKEICMTFYPYLLFLHHVFLCFPAMVVIPQGYSEPWSVLPSTTGPLHRLFFCWNYFVYGLMLFPAIPLPPLIPNSMIFYSEKISFFHFLCFGFVFNLEWEFRTYICCFLGVRSGALGRWGR